MRYEVLHLKDRFPFLGENDCDPTLEVYLQETIKEGTTWNLHWQQKRPSILMCPGGAYWGCSRREAEPIALHFLPEGFNVFVLTYSTKAEDRFPTQIREVAAAMELIYENATDWCCDPQRIAVMGGSAGGHLAAHYTNYYNCKEVKALFPNSKQVNACILAYPVITADPDHCHRVSIEKIAGHFPLAQEEYPIYSCEYQVTEQTPPTFIWHTAEDASVPVQNSLLYAGALAKHNIPFELHVYPYGSHGRSTADYQTCKEIEPGMEYLSDWLTCAKKWLKLTFKTP